MMAHFLRRRCITRDSRAESALRLKANIGSRSRYRHWEVRQKRRPLLAAIMTIGFSAKWLRAQWPNIYERFRHRLRSLA